MGSTNTTFTGKPLWLTSPWTSKTPKHYKQNTINGYLYHSKRFSSNFDKETLLIIDKFIKVQYPLRFINSVHNEIQKSTDHGYEYFIIWPHSFGITKPFISTERPCRVLNEIKSTDFLKKFWKFVNDGFRLAIAGKTINFNHCFLKR